MCLMPHYPRQAVVSLLRQWVIPRGRWLLVVAVSMSGNRVRVVSILLLVLALSRVKLVFLQSTLVMVVPWLMPPEWVRVHRMQHIGPLPAREVSRVKLTLKPRPQLE